MRDIGHSGGPPCTDESGTRTHTEHSFISRSERTAAHQQSSRLSAITAPINDGVMLEKT